MLFMSIIAIFSCSVNFGAIYQKDTNHHWFQLTKNTDKTKEKNKTTNKAAFNKAKVGLQWLTNITVARSSKDRLN